MVEENGTDALQSAALSRVVFCFLFFLYRSKAGSFARSTSLTGGKKKVWEGDTSFNVAQAERQPKGKKKRASWEIWHTCDREEKKKTVNVIKNETRGTRESNKQALHFFSKSEINCLSKRAQSVRFAVNKTEKKEETKKKEKARKHKKKNRSNKRHNFERKSKPESQRLKKPG